MYRGLKNVWRERKERTGTGWVAASLAQQVEPDRGHQLWDSVCKGPGAKPPKPTALLVLKAVPLNPAHGPAHTTAVPKYRSQCRALLPDTHRPRNSKVHDNNCCDLPPAPMLTAMEEEDPPEGVKENQHHGHKSCREWQRSVSREPPALTWPRGSGRDVEELGE